MMKRLVLPSLMIMAAAVCGYYVGLQEKPTTRLIKRVVGSPGDRFEVREGVVFVNGTRLPD
jgi:type IV secretory pathway protease TraF